MEIELKVLNHKTPTPCYATSGSAGVDLHAAIVSELTIMPNQTAMIGSGIAININQPNYAAVVLPRSGLGAKHGIVLGNLTGLIDSDYQGEIKLAIWNRSGESFTVKPMERLAQMIIVPVVQVNFKKVEIFSQKTERGSGGFGSTGS